MSNYNVTATIPHEEVSARFMDAGIHDNVEMTKLEFGISPNGNKFLAFYFKNENGEIGSHTEWEPTNADPAKNAEKELNQISRVKQIARCFITNEEFVFSAVNFEDFAKQVIARLQPRIAGVKLRTKFVYSNGNFTSLPTYWKFRFIERMDNNNYYGDKKSDKTSIRILTGMDKMSKVTPDQIANVTPNPFAQTLAVGTPSPF